MKQNFDDFSILEAQRLASSDIGKQLIALFQQQQGAPSQDPAQLKQAVAAFMQDPKAQALLKKLQEENHGRNGR